MPTSVRCILCLNKKLEKHFNEEITIQEELIKAEPFNITTNIIPKNDTEDLQLLGGAMITHMKLIHPDELQKVAILAVHWNGFNVMKNFETQSEDSIFEKEKEKMRDQLVEEVMKFAPEDDFDEDEEEDEGDELEEDDDDEYEDEEENDLTKDDEGETGG